MAVLRFDGKEVFEILKESREAKGHGAPYKPGVDPGPGLYFVKDSGAYLMSNANEQSSPARVAYAKGLGPDDYIAVRAACGGDDFAELFTDEQLARFFPCETFIITLTKTSMKISALLPKVGVTSKPTSKK